MRKFNPLLSVTLIVAAFVSAEAAEKPISPDELGIRRYLNEHVILVNNDGRAIEPWDYYTSGTFNRKLTSLQVPDPHDPPNNGNDEEQKRWDKSRKAWDTAIAHSGCVGMPSIPHPPNADAFVFRDYIVQRMIKKAEGKKILIFVHGGMNSLSSGIERAYWMAPEIEKAGYYPIFLCWNSNLFSTWWQHITSIRNGRNASNDIFPLRWLYGGVYVATDVATSAVQLPRSMLDLAWASTKPTLEDSYTEVLDAKVREYHLRAAAAKNCAPCMEDMQTKFAQTEDAVNSWRHRDYRWAHPFGSKEEPPPAKFELTKSAQFIVNGWSQIQLSHGDWKPITVSKGQKTRQLSDEIMRFAGGWGLLAPKLLVVGAFGGVGSESWDIMLRRVEMLYHHESSYQPMYSSMKFNVHRKNLYSEADEDVRYSSSTGVGAMSVLLRSIQTAQEKNKAEPLVVIGHSMGAIVLNRALSNFPDLKIDTVAYLAAACTIKDTCDTLIPYLNRHPETQFYNLCLNPRADDREIPLDGFLGELVPRGSLLVWIDEFLNKPYSMPGRTLGHFENALLCSPMFPAKVQKQMHMVALACGPGSGETIQKHGSFGKHKFWEKDFYEKEGTESRATFEIHSAAGKIPKNAAGAPSAHQ